MCKYLLKIVESETNNFFLTKLKESKFFVFYFYSLIFISVVFDDFKIKYFHQILFLLSLDFQSKKNQLVFLGQDNQS